tara:strand:+ start:11857 stop:12372 length:516 start_codon:yes stop_codon:yes gene_type:complete
MIRENIQRGFTLVETMVAISVMVIAVTAPLTLASQSLFAAVYAKDQMTSFYLAQEAIEVVREKREGNFMKIINGQSGVTWLDGIPADTDFLVDVPNDSMTACSGSCFATPLLHNGFFYNYTSGDATRFSRRARVTVTGDEALIQVDVRWRTGAFQERTITISERIYNWVPR